MGKFFEAELKDKFLKFAASKDNYFELRLLYNEFLHPHYSLEYASRLVSEILEYDPELLDVMSGNGFKVFMISSTAATKAFVAESSFCQLVVQEEEKWDNFLKQVSTLRQLSKKEKSLLDTTQRQSLRNEKKWLVPISSVFGLSIVLNICLLGYIIFGDNGLTTGQNSFEKVSDVQSLKLTSPKKKETIEFKQDSLLVRKKD